MITSIGQSIDVLKNEYGLERELVIEVMKEAIQAAARKQFKSEYKGGEGIQVDWNNEEGLIEISAQKTVVDEVESPTTELSIVDAVEMTGDDEIELGDMLLIPLPTEELGRIAAQTAKQILMQKVREAVREKVYEEYIDRKGELINGLVKRFERGDMIVDMGTNFEAVLPRREQSRGETWNINERLRVVIADVTKESRGQQVIVSRASADLLKRLFEMEVPEIYDDTVTIKSAVREPGDRAKIAVTSNEKDVDPVGACVGMKGARVQSVIKELRGEKIDIIEWSDEPSVFAANSLSPAKVSQVRITDINERKIEVIVAEDQLSLAIGKYGQNVRLATRLVGWDIDIIGEDVLKKEIAAQMDEMMASGDAVPISLLEGVSANHVEVLATKGIEDIDALAETSVDDLVDTLDISLDEAGGIILAAKTALELRDKEEKSEDEAESTSTEEISEDSETEKTEEKTETSVEEDKKPEDVDSEETVEKEKEEKGEKKSESSDDDVKEDLSKTENEEAEDEAPDESAEQTGDEAVEKEESDDTKGSEESDAKEADAAKDEEVSSVEDSKEKK